MECIKPMSKFESSVRQIPYSQEAVYKNVSNLTNLDKVRDRVPEDKIQDFVYDEDSVSLNVSPVGTLKLRIIDRQEPKCVKFESEQSPVHFYLWIQILPVTEESSKMKLTIEADIPFMLKPMVEGPLKDGIEKIADALSQIAYV